LQKEIATMPITAVASLYDQIGGAPAVELLVDRFYEHLWADTSLAKFFVGIDRTELKRHQRMFLMLALGAGQYAGQPLKVAHRDLQIDDAAFDTVARHLTVTMRELEIDPPAIMIINSAVAGLRPEVVTV